MYRNCDNSCALKKMVLPGAIAVFSPVIIGLGFGAEMLGGLLGGGLLSCVLLALTMSNAGGAWDNAKKYVEQGNLGGKGSDVHTAAVVGDTVGDPLKRHIRTVNEYINQCYGNC